jgi:hypothetical protein
MELQLGLRQSLSRFCDEIVTLFAFVELRPSRAARNEEIAVMRKITIIALVLGLLGPCAFAQSTEQPRGAVQGVVFTPVQADAGKVHRSVKASDHYPISFELRSASLGLSRRP